MSDGQQEQREYGQLIATVEHQTQAISELKDSFDKLVSQSEFEYRMGSLESKLDQHKKATDYRHSESERKIEGLQDTQKEMYRSTATSTEKLANTERLIWLGLTIVSGAIIAYLKGLI